MQTKSNAFALAALTALFFAMGFITVLNDVLIPHLKKIFELNHTEAVLVQFCFFGAYFITGGFFGKLLEKIGYPAGVVLGFVFSAIGCILFYPAASSASYPIFLGALFILASGVVLLQTAGNPFVTLLAPGKEASALTLVQAFNSLGTTLGPLFGAYLIASNTQKVIDKVKEAQSVQIPYLVIAGALIVLALIVYLLKLPDVRERAEQISEHNHDGKKSALGYSHFVFGVGAIFFYVGGEVSIGSFLVLTMEEIAHIPEKVGAHNLIYYWGGAMVGRFIGSAVMQKIAPNTCLAFNAGVNVLLLAIALALHNATSIYFLLAIGLFNSIMFPTIFSLATKGLGRFTSQASGIICMAIVGGAVVPLIQGYIADIHSLGLLISYMVPMACYVYILIFAVYFYSIRERTHA
ncbi:sugar MFS transporter [Helicobacter ailurogastricus]|uniref:Homolog of fucose/glucose/galactose permeases n=1 Tax=Helicobacter ailurogastricus TaxID=1578720 RepID=A0A0K2XZG2_9HELI|nr:sugar MFS transporter [Helicobacter ailurogastricus]BDQ29608.1 putative glucose/galactose transporter [Helicobacter ailurogastricus]GLH58561.1 Glucose/galactose transporter GluP [Helicobacter ailurogastricus]GLH60135.1 Glucose/galactose transporter GluP [Helicobacter ailurogastricus]CRF52481.1 Homolog of fucose/glucose/galactose permeases [Helicobacter ailurogastricus]